jgi:hypothetical protein
VSLNLELLARDIAELDAAEPVQSKLTKDLITQLALARFLLKEKS